MMTQQDYRQEIKNCTYTNCITAIAQTTKIIKLNHVYLYDIQTDHI